MKTLTTFLFVSLIIQGSDCAAQFVTDWTANYQHTPQTQFANQARKTACNTITGDLYVLQDVTSDLDLQGNPTSNTFHYTVLSRYNSGGTFQNQYVVDVGTHLVNGFEYSSSFGLEIDGSGNVYIGYNSYNGTTLRDLNISKLDNLLSLQWNSKFNPTTEDIGIALKATDQGNAYAILKSLSGTNIRHRLFKATGAGSTTSAFYTFTPQPDYLTSLAVDPSENVYVAGYRLIAGIKAFLYASLTPAGTLRWIRTYDCSTPNNDDFLSNISFGADGQIYITGTSLGTVQHGNDVITCKINSASGKKIWENVINFTLSDGGGFVIAHDLANVYVAWTSENTVYVDLIQVSSGRLVRRIPYTPIPLYSHTVINNVTISEMKVSNSSGVYLCGTVKAADGSDDFTASYLIKTTFVARNAPVVEYEIPVLGDPAASRRGVSIALNNNTDHSYFLEDIAETYSSHIQETIILNSYDMQGALRIQQPDPNEFHLTNVFPSNDQLIINTTDNMHRIELLDVNGKTIKTVTGNQGTTASLDIAQFPTGIYFLRVFSVSGQAETRKVHSSRH